MALDDVVNVVVNINQSTVAQQGFGVPLVFAPTPYGELVRTYKASSWSTAMAEDGFSPYSTAYKCVEQMMKQSPRPTTVKVGKRTGVEQQILRITPVVANSTVYTVLFESPAGVKYTASFASDASATAAEIATGLASAITTAAPGMTADGSSGTYVAVTGVGDRVYSVYRQSPNMAITSHTVVSDAGTIGTQLSLIDEYDADWYALALPSSAPEAIEACADWVETRRKLFVASTDDAGTLTNGTTDIVSSIKTQAYQRTHVAYHSKAGEFYGPSWMAAMLVYQPGQADWTYKTLKGVTADKISATEEQNLVAKYGSFYGTLVGRQMTGIARAGDGVYLDLTQLEDWATVRIIERVIGALNGTPTKIPLTDQGAGNTIFGILQNVLAEGIQNQAIDPDPSTQSVIVLKRSEISAEDLAARIWPGSSLSFRPTSAVHSFGTITVNINVAV